MDIKYFMFLRKKNLYKYFKLASFCPEKKNAQFLKLEAKRETPKQEIIGIQ